jgi:hypothetical protein
MSRIRIEPPAQPRYAALVESGVLECTIAIGYDEHTESLEGDYGGARHRVDALVRALCVRGYVEGRDAARPLLARRGRDTNGACSIFLSRQRAFGVVSAASGERSADVVIRIVANTNGALGPDAAHAFVDGLAHSSICVYAGHARYGLGPDFEPALVVESTPDGAGVSTDANSLRRMASKEAASRGIAFEAVLDEWVAIGRLAIRRSAASRVLVDDGSLGRRNPRARLMRWLAASDRGERSPVAFGPRGLLASAADARHRFWFLLACRSAAWFPAIRSTPGLNTSALSIVGCTGQAGPGDVNRFAWALDAMSAGESWKYVLRALEDPPSDHAERFVVDGVCDSRPPAPRHSA